VKTNVVHCQSPNIRNANAILVDMERAYVWVYGIAGFVVGGLLGALGVTLLPDLNPNLILIIPSVSAVVFAIVGIWMGTVRARVATPTIVNAGVGSQKVPRLTWVLVVLSIMAGLIISALH
jgi:hypothetical protein